MQAVTPPAGTAGIRPAAVAGLFYPEDAADLCRLVDALLAAAPPAAAAAPVPKVLIAPHAGYVYSGPTAAAAYARLRPSARRIRRVVLLGPVHRVPVRGLALPGATALATPLGTIAVDELAIKALRALPQVVTSASAHALEHSLEVHLPFLQRMLADFTVVPLAVGEATAEEVAQVLDLLWGGEETLIIVSSDLSHYSSYERARRIDRDTVDAMLALRADIDPMQACGARPLNGLLLLARKRGLRAELIDLRNSGDTSGDRDRVVGYAAIALHEPMHAQQGPQGEDLRDDQAQIDDDRGALLLSHARAAIAEALGLPAPAAREAACLQQPGASFVTLKVDGELRGCIGSLHAQRPLVEDVRMHARAAAFEDPRFPPLTRHEYAGLSVEVSVLSAAEPLPARSEHEALVQLRPGVDGLILESAGRRATFLPQVWEQLPTPAQFLRALRRKAGLPVDAWSDDIRLSRYTVNKHAERA